MLPIDAGRKFNVHKTFRRRPGRLLSVLRTFNLRPVSTGLNTEIYLVNLLFQSECRKMQAKKLRIRSVITLWTFQKNQQFSLYYMGRHFRVASKPPVNWPLAKTYVSESFRTCHPRKFILRKRHFYPGEFLPLKSYIHSIC